MNDVERLSREYAARVDARDWDGAAELFTEDGSLVVPDPPEHLGPTHIHTGRDRIRAAFADLDATDSTRHVLTGVEPDGRVACLAHHVMGDRCVDWHLHYADEYAETAEGVRFRRRELFVRRIDVHDPEPPTTGRLVT